MSTQDRVSTRVPPTVAQATMSVDRAKYGLPTVARLRQTTAISDAISRIIAADETISAFHREMVRGGICSRYQLALSIAADKDAFAAFSQDPRINALARPPTKVSDTLVSLFNATYADPKEASKYFKRIEHLWVKQRPADEVLAFLERHGLNKPASPSKQSRQPRRGVRKTPAVEKQQSVDDDKTTPLTMLSAINSKDDRPAGSIPGV